MTQGIFEPFNAHLGFSAKGKHGNAAASRCGPRNSVVNCADAAETVKDQAPRSLLQQPAQRLHRRNGMGKALASQHPKEHKISIPPLHTKAGGSNHVRVVLFLGQPQHIAVFRLISQRVEVSDAYMRTDVHFFKGGIAAVSRDKQISLTYHGQQVRFKITAAYYYTAFFGHRLPPSVYYLLMSPPRIYLPSRFHASIPTRTTSSRSMSI